MGYRVLRSKRRRGVVLVMSAFLIVVVCAMAAMAIDVGFMMLVRTQLQAAADAGALAGANALHESRPEILATGEQFATSHIAGGRNIRADETEVEIGIWDVPQAAFVVTSGIGNAVRVTCRRSQEGLFFARVLGINVFTTEASAIAMSNPKDIAFVMDLSGSMNDDTEPAWATSTVNGQFGGGVGSKLMQDVYQDFGFGVFPGPMEYLGAPVRVPQGESAYAEMTSDIGPLSTPSTPLQFRIQPGDSERTRRQKCYGWVIENQLRRLMPQARPSADLSNYGFWEKYIDYVIRSAYIKAPTLPKPPAPPEPPSIPGPITPDPPPPPTPPKPPTIPPPEPPIGFVPAKGLLNRFAGSPGGVLTVLAARRLGIGPAAAGVLTAKIYGAGGSGVGLPRVGGLGGGYSIWLPPDQDGDRIDQFNNPNPVSFPSASRDLPRAFRNYFGYVTYVQFLMDHGKDLKPDGATYCEISTNSSFCPRHNESVAGRTFSFPPREMPMHAVRRASISALNVLEERNAGVPDSAHRDHVAVITYDTVAGTRVLQPLTADHVKAMNAVTDLQAAGDKGTTTAAESGLILAKKMLQRRGKGGRARDNSTRVVVMLTDGMPNAYESPAAQIVAFASGDGAAESYGGGYLWLDAALMQANALKADRIDVYPAGVGLGTDADFMDRVARLGGTAGDDNAANRGSGDPGEYERVLTEIFEEIISLPTARMVQ